MAKKKSKTQKYKKNLKRKLNKTAENISKNKSTILELNKEEKEKLKKKISIEEQAQNEETKETHKKIVEKDKIDYNVLITYENKEKIKKEKSKDDGELSKTKDILKKEIKREIKDDIKKEISKLDSPQKIIDSESLDDITSPFIEITKQSHKKNKTYLQLVLSRIKKQYLETKNKNKNKKKTIKQTKKTAPGTDIVLPKLKDNSKNKKTDDSLNLLEIKKEKKTTNSKNPIIRLLVEMYNNAHIIFNGIGIVIFIIMIVGLVRIDVFQSKTIVYIGFIVGFLLFVAVSFNKYISGKIFTTLLSIGMMVAICYMQYTYDFIRNLNSGLYEYKTYYVVTFDNGLNKSIYNINNKKVGLLKDNCVNIERKLDTKIEPVYVEYEDINALFNDFYEQNFRAILVNENQYKYMKNNIQNNRAVKILYEFKANARK